MFNFYDCNETRRLVYPKVGTYKTREEAETIELTLKQEAETPYSQIVTCDAGGNPIQEISTRILISGDGFLVELIAYDRLEDLNTPFPPGFEYEPSYELNDICNEDGDSGGEASDIC